MVLQPDVYVPPPNLIANPGYEDGKSPWVLFSDAQATFATTTYNVYEGDYAGQVSITTAGSNVQLYQTGISLTEGQRYRLSFAARSNSGHDVTVHLLKHVDPYTSYWQSPVFNLTSSWQTFTVEFIPENLSGVAADTRFRFWLGSTDAAGDRFYFDSISLTTATDPTPNSVIYVKADASGANTGGSWADAFTNLQDALAAAWPGDQIWVAAGLYTPASGSDRTATFRMVENVPVYGGFSGSESSLAERNWSANLTILSGNIGDPGSSTDNSYTVVTIPKKDTSFLLDGLIIADGYGGRAGDSGAGVLADFYPDYLGEVILRNTIIENNYAAERGGGIYLRYARSIVLDHATLRNNQSGFCGGGACLWNPLSATITNSLFSGNHSSFGGGLDLRLAESGTLYSIANSRFTANLASTEGGAAHLEGYGENADLRLANLLVDHNTAPNGGGLTLYFLRWVEVDNVTVANNQASGSSGLGGGIDYFPHSSSGYPSTLRLQNSILWGNTAASGADLYRDDLEDDYSLVEVAEVIAQPGGLYNSPANNLIELDPLFVDADGADDTPGTADDDYRLQSGSPAIDSGNSGWLPADYSDLDGDGDIAELLPIDLDGNPRTSGAAVDRGAYEYFSSQQSARPASDSLVDLLLSLPGNLLFGDTGVIDPMLHGEAREEVHRTALRSSKPLFALVARPAQSQTTTSYSWQYQYDGLSRLIYACANWDAVTSTCQGDSFTYQYDGAGNLLSFSRWDGSAVETVRFVYNSANQIACRDGDASGTCGDAGDTPYSYDAYGNLTQDGVKTYSYDAENRLLSVSDGASTTSYTYNGDGDRMSQTVDGVTTSYVLDPAAPLTMVLAETTGAETVYYLHGLDLLVQYDGASTEYFAYDGLGSVRQVVDGAGDLLFAQSFDPYGNPYASVGTDSTSWGFTGEQTDSSGLVYLRARYYDPYLNQFIQRDPNVPDPSQPWEWNPYTYSRNNPINYTDPSGMCAQGDEPCLKAAQRLFEDYGWYFVGQWQVTEIELLRDAAKEIAEFFDNHGGNGQARMRGALSPAWFTRAGLLWRKLGYHHVESQTVYLITGFSKDAVIHESAHVLDNLAGSSTYASLFGGGPSDDMARSLGVDPTQCPFRFSCSNYFKMLDEAGSELPPSNYAARGPSEDFAVTFEYLVTGNGDMQKAPVRGDWMARFIEANKRTRPAYEGNPYQYLWFLPQPIPVPECSLPRVLVTPQP